MTLIIKAFESPDGEHVYYSDEIEINVAGRPSARFVMAAVDRAIDEVRRKVANVSTPQDPLR